MLFSVKKHFWDAGVFHEINSLRRGENDIKIPSSDEVESDYDTRRKTRHSSDNPDTIVTRLLSTSWPMTYDAVGNMKLDDNKKNIEKDVYNEQYKMKGIGMREFEVGEIDSGVNQSAQTISENRCFNQNSTSARAGVLSRMLSGSHISVGENVESSSTSYSQPGCGNNQVTQLHSSKKVPTIEDVKLGFDLSQHCSTLPNHRFTKDSATFLSSEAKSTQSSRRPSLNSLDDEVFVTDRVPKTFLHSHLKGLNSSSIDDHCSPLFDVRTGNALKIEFSAISPKKLLRGNSGSSDHDSSFDIHLRTLLAESPSIPYDTGHRLPPNVSGITTSLGSQASGDSLVLDSHSLQNPPAVAAKVEDNQSGSSFEGMIKAQDTNKEEADDSPNTSNASLSSKEDGPNDLTENNSKPVSPTARDTVKSVLEQILTLSAIMEDANESSCHSEHVASLLQVVNEIKTQDDFPPVEIPSVD